MTNTDKMEVSINEPLFLITDRKVSSIQDLLPLLELLTGQEKRDLVIITEDVSEDTSATLVVNKMRGTLNVLAVKAPEVGEHCTAWLQDIALVMGGQLISQEMRRSIATMTLEDLGRARRVIATRDATTLVGGKGSSCAIQECLYKCTSLS